MGAASRVPRPSGAVGGEPRAPAGLAAGPGEGWMPWALSDFRRTLLILLLSVLITWSRRTSRPCGGARRAVGATPGPVPPVSRGICEHDGRGGQEGGGRLPVLRAMLGVSPSPRLCSKASEDVSPPQRRPLGTLGKAFGHGGLGRWQTALNPRLGPRCHGDCCGSSAEQGVLSSSLAGGAVPRLVQRCLV